MSATLAGQRLTIADLPRPKRAAPEPEPPGRKKPLRHHSRPRGVEELAELPCEMAEASKHAAPTPEHRRLVSCLASMRVSQEAICQILVRDHEVPCSSPVTLRKQFRDELRYGHEHVIASLGHRLYEIAMAGNVPAIVALLRVLDPRWRQQRGEESAGPSQAPEEVQQYASINGQVVPVTNEVAIVMPDNGRHRRDTDANDRRGPVIEHENSSD
jgi:hypothetical protein